MGGLHTYQQKRRFDRTPEPVGSARSDSGRSFVVQKHAARNLHYDFRLELDGVLKSWAVPKGPSLDPARRALAVQVEDHPVAYRTFEGTIPQGEYGGGTVMVWDEGTWSTDGDPDEQLRKGRLVFELQGKKLRGRWSLVRMNHNRGRDGRNWLLVKGRDQYASDRIDILQSKPLSVQTRRSLEQIGHADDANSKATTKSIGRRNAKKKRIQAPGASNDAMPAALTPMLATLVDKVPAGGQWIHEVKLDGYRFFIRVEAGTIRLITRNNKDWTDRFPDIAAAAQSLKVGNTILDGELVVFHKDGRTSFQALQNHLQQGKRPPAVWIGFDVPYLDGRSLVRTPLLERKEILRKLLARLGKKAGRFLRYSEHFTVEGKDVFSEACRLGLEGLISKRVDSTYQSARSRDWVKTKCIQNQEFVIVGYTRPQGSRTAFGSLLLGYHDDNGKLAYAGRVGAGFTVPSLQRIHARLLAIVRPDTAVDSPMTPAERRGVQWVQPQLIAQVEFSEWTRDRRLRRPVFKGLREDKPAEEVVMEKPKHAVTAAAQKGRKNNGKVEVAGVPLSNPQRAVYPEQGLTKQDLAEYYMQVADHLLPHVADRPLSLLRCPQGREQTCFFQKHLTDAMPDAVKGVKIKEENGAGIYITVRDLKGVVSLVQFGAMEFHPWGCRIDQIEKPDRLIFDLDPGPDVAWSAVVDAAIDLRKHLEALDLVSFVKTSGGKGLHVVLPIDRKNTWDDAKSFTRALASMLAAASPDRYTAVMSKARRAGRIFIDYLRNGRGATSVAAYSTRARKGAPVSAPLRWNELPDLADAAAFTVINLPQRLRKQKKIPWAEFFSVRQSLTANRLRAVGL